MGARSVRNPIVKSEHVARGWEGEGKVTREEVLSSSGDVGRERGD